MQYITRDNLFKLIDQLTADYDVYVPVKKGQQRYYAPYAEDLDNIVLGEVRAFEPLKAFFMRAREVVSEGFKDAVPHAQDKPMAIIGVKACDLKGFKVQDFVFKTDDCPDPSYIKNRQENLIISSDCTCAIDTCFCLAMGIKPHPDQDYDVNLSEVEGVFLVQAGSPKGEDLLQKNASLLDTASQEMETKYEVNREAVINEVIGNLKKIDMPQEDQFKDIIEKNYDADIWADEAKTCVECGACNTICPTCHCFFLSDQKKNDIMTRTRLWDSCLIKDFARVAGGANPRDKLWMRLRNRFDKKFDYFPKVADIYACTGCGRCVAACPAKIDIRKVLKRLVDNVQK